MRLLALDSLRSVPGTTVAYLAAILLAAACASDDLTAENSLPTSAGGQAGATVAGQGGAAGQASGSSGQGGAGGAAGKDGAGKGGASGQGGAGQAGTSGSSGQGGVTTAGAAGETSGGAGSDAGAAGDMGMSGASGSNAGAAGAAGGCDPGQLYYADTDGDGHGNPAHSQMGCPAGGKWVASKDDCDDSNPDVFGGQTDYFAVPYPRAGFPDDLSFDYDCNNTEEHDPGSDTNDCSGASLECPQKGGAVATKRKGTGVDAFCGSTTKVECKNSFTGCQEGEKSPIAPVRCH